MPLRLQIGYSGLCALIAGLALASAAHAQPPAAVTAADLDGLCRRYDPACAQFMTATVAQLQREGVRLCGAASGDGLGNWFVRFLSTQPELVRADARFAARMAIRARLQCGVNR